LRCAALKQEHLEILKVMSENYSEAIKEYSDACKEKDKQILKLKDQKQASETKISDLEMVVMKMESDKTVGNNIQEDLRKLLKSGKIVSDNKIDELETRIKKLQKVVDASKGIAIEAEYKLNAAIRNKNDTDARMKIVKQKLDTKIEQSINQEQEYYEAGARMREGDIAVLNLNKELDILVKEAGQMEILMNCLRDKIDLLEKSLKVHRENDTKRLNQLMVLKKEIASILTSNKELSILVRETGQMETLKKDFGEKIDFLVESLRVHRENDIKRLAQLMELKNEIALKDEQIAQYRRQKANPEAPVVNQSSDVDLKQLEQPVNEVDDMRILDSLVSRLPSYESEMSFSHRRSRTEEFECEEVSLSDRTNENQNMIITSSSTFRNPVVKNKETSLQNSSMLIKNRFKILNRSMTPDEKVVDI